MKIMAALDMSDYADFILTKAIKTAKQQKAKMDIVIVVEEQDGFTGGALSGQVAARSAIEQARRYQQKAVSSGVRTKVRVLSGLSAAKEIVRYQQAEKLDLIVIGRRNRSGGQQDSPIGPVAQYVTAYATCTVMVVRSMEERDYKK